jgi:signal transduction histidine kinase/CheY-like chemotaxis protein
MHRERMAGFMDSASESFHLVDSNLGIIEINERAMQALRGVAPGIESKEDVVGRTLLDIYPLMQGEGGESQFRNVVETGESMKFDSSVEHPVHGTVHMTVQAFKVGDDLGIIATDISDRKRAEEERLHLERQVQHAQKLESLGLLAGGIAHDFNNLLVGVLGGTDLALQHISPTSPARELLEDVTEAAHRAGDLANQMLAYSGKGRFIVEPTDLSALIKEMFQLIEASVPKKCRIAYELDDDLPATEVDVTQIRQIALNLVVNAAEAIGEEVGTVAIATGSLQCDREDLAKVYPGDEAEEGRYVYLEVKDSGVGMDSETVQKIFDPFFTTKTTGRGLGLAAALGIVRGHQGAIKVESEPDRGTTMTILLPASEKTALNRTRKLEAQGDWQGSGLVLLVDDEEMVRTVIEAMLRRLGFDVVVATDGRQGVEVFRQQADDIALVVLDLTMPVMSGDDACQEIRRIKSDARVLLSSGFHKQDVTGKFAASGPDGFIQKPYRLDTLTQTIREILDS